MSESKTLEENDESNSYRFKLNDPLSYATKSGDQETALWIELRPPTTRNRRECAALKQAFFRAASEQDGSDDESRDGESAEKPTGIGVITIMAMSTKVELPEVMEVAAKLFSSGVAQVEGETKLTAKLIESLSQEDFERMIGEYLVNFTLASALEQSGTKTS